MSKQRQIRLGAFLQATSHHVAAWLHPKSQADAEAHVLPTALTDFIDQVAPILRKRGLFRTDYESETLRETLGLERPRNIHASQRLDEAAAPTVELARAAFS